jgi:hypothetical protein
LSSLVQKPRISGMYGSCPGGEAGHCQMPGKAGRTWKEFGQEGNSRLARHIFSPRLQSVRNNLSPRTTIKFPSSKFTDSSSFLVLQPFINFKPELRQVRRLSPVFSFFLKHEAKEWCD